MSSLPMRKQLRRALRKLMWTILPRSVSFWWIRRALDFSIPLKSSKYHFEIASHLDDFKSALALVQKNFEKEGYAPVNSANLRMTPYHLLPGTLVIVAKLQERVIGTISVIPRTPFGIPLDEVVELDNLTQGKGLVVEISALAVAPDIRGEQGEVLFNMMKFMYHCNVDLLNASIELIGVNPKMIPLYQAVLLFEKVPGGKIAPYDFANGAPVVPMYFSLHSAKQTYERVYQGRPTNQNIMDFFLSRPGPQFNLPSAANINRILPQINPDQLREILNWDKSVLLKLSSKKTTKLLELYEPWPECKDLIQKAMYAEG